MQFDRTPIIVDGLKALGVGVGRSTRYANDTGTCLWCANGALVMVPDDPEKPWFCQAKGADELLEQLTPLVEPRLAKAAADAAVAADAIASNIASMTSGQRALIQLGDQLRQEGYEEALVESREMFAAIMRGKFGSLPPPVEQRIRRADFSQLHRWSKRLFTLPRAILVVA